GPGGPGGPSGEDTPPPPLPPPPDLAPVKPAIAGAPPPATPGVTIEQGCAVPQVSPCPRYALDGVYQALAATEAGTAAAPVRIEFYGDSVSASDAIPGRLRARLQAAFGDGGPGFLHAIAPHRFNYSQQVERTSSGSWSTWNVALTRVADDLYGLGESTAEGSGTLRFRLRDAERTFSHAELWYLAQPHGGAADLIVDGEVAASVDTSSEAKVPAFQPISLPDAPHKLDVKTTRGKVRLFGVTFERDRGVVVDNLAVVSATAANLRNNQEDHWRSQLAHRAPSLVVFMIGTNEAQWIAGGKAMSDYATEWSALLAPVRAARPEASCLVVAPLDQAEVRDGKLVPRRSMPRMIATQRRAAELAGCAFWDSFTWMGGSGSSIKWNARGLLGSDFAHPSPKGMAMVADALTDALIAGYREYKGRTQP
ncbi:MAG TPA: GDSL-type esterase/lipase family protein, partial [Kofleriaceae bacterium]|nr:GDSL-type esterase/lipase family protein [Kofleriaceae bacterium]